MMRNAVRFALMFALVLPACGRAVAADPPRLTAISLDGQPWRSSEHVGKVVVVDFWATWCGPCIDQIPQLQKLYLSHRGHPDFEMVSVALDTDAERVGRVAAQHHLTWTQALDPAGPLRNEIMALAGHRIPALAILRKSGALDGVWHDARDADFSLRALLSGPRASLEHPPEKGQQRMGVRNAPGDAWATGDAYEAYMGRWSRPLARAFVEWLHPRPSANWLEVGCGTGALTSTLCEICEPASVVACDPSEPFIEHARRSLSDPRVSFVSAGSDALPRRDGGFDVVVSGLVLNFLPDPGEAVARLRDRVRAGGAVAAYVWDYAEGMEFLRCFWDEAVAADARAAPLDEGRRFPLCRRPALASLFEAAGLTRVETAPIEIPTLFATFDDYWTPFLRGTGPAPSYVASLDVPGRESLRERLGRRLQAGSDGRIHLRARAWAVRGIST